MSRANPPYRGFFTAKCVEKRLAPYGRAKVLHPIKQIPKARQLFVADKEIRGEPFERTANPGAGNEKRKKKTRKKRLRQLAPRGCEQTLTTPMMHKLSEETLLMNENSVRISTSASREHATINSAVCGKKKDAKRTE